MPQILPSLLGAALPAWTAEAMVAWISAWSQGLLIKRKTSPSLTEPTIAARSE